MSASPSLMARAAGAFYLLTIIAGGSALVSERGRAAMLLVASLCYVAVTLLFYPLFKPVSRNLSLIAALVSLAGCTIGLVSGVPNPLVLFGVYCLLIGYLTFTSTFLPRLLGVLMAFGGAGWLTFASPRLASALAPYNFAPGIFGEGALTLWLLVFGVDVPRWEEQAASQRRA
jgi:Domain of unknown function (DUF4386)